MKNLPFMKEEEWDLDAPCRLKFFDNFACQPRHRCRKPEMVFTNLQGYSPVGTTGNGRCSNGKCGQRFWVGKQFHHYGQLGRHPSLGPKGPGAAKLKNELPVRWMQEFLTQAIKESSPQQHVFVDFKLFAGWQSWKPVCEQFGIFVFIGLLLEDSKRFGSQRSLLL